MAAAGPYQDVDISYRMVWTLLSHDNRDVVEMLTAWDEEAVGMVQEYIEYRQMYGYEP